MRTRLHKIALVSTFALTTALVSACKDHETVAAPGARGSLVQTQAPLNTLGEDLPFVEIATEARLLAVSGTTS